MYKTVKHDNDDRKHMIFMKLIKFHEVKLFNSNFFLYSIQNKSWRHVSKGAVTQVPIVQKKQKKIFFRGLRNIYTADI